MRQSATVTICILLGIGGAQIPACAQGPDSWTTGAPMPTALQGPATGVIGGLVYVVGGANNSTTFNINQIYNPTSNSWTTGAAMPTARFVPAGAVVDNILYVIGGKLNGRQLNVVEAYDPTSDTWSTNYSPMPTAADSIKAVVVDGIIYVIGGYNNGSGRLKSVQSYNPATDTWTEEEGLVVGKSLPGVGVLGSTIVAAAGLADSGATGDNEGYSFSSNSWAALTPDPTPRFNVCSGVLSGQLYVAGGQNNSGATNVAESFNLADNQWTTLLPMPTKTSTPGEAVVSNLLYCFGGFGSSPGLSNEVQIYHPGPPPAPMVSNVVSASAFGGFTDVAPGSWIEIYGSNLATDTRQWGSADFNGVNAPTSLDGTFVTVGGQSAFVYYISPGQVDAQVPSNVGTGLQEIRVQAGGGTSSTFNITVNAVEPGLLAPASFDLNGIQYAVATFSGGTYVLPAGAIAGMSSRAASPGDTVVLYGVGFGPVTPDIPAGQIVQAENQLTSQFQISIGGAPATVSYAGLAPTYVGLYQFNVVVPNVPVSDAAPVTFTLAGASGTQTLYLAIGN